MIELKIGDEVAVKLKSDNKSAINLAKNSIFHGKRKHVETRFHFMRDQVNKNELIVEYCPTQDQLTDLFTKALKRDQFLKLRREIRVVNFDSLNKERVLVV